MHVMLMMNIDADDEDGWWWVFSRTTSYAAAAAALALVQVAVCVKPCAAADTGAFAAAVEDCIALA